MKLLTPTQPAELPEEALLARVRCRRAALDLRAAQPIETATEAFSWVYQRLNRRLRRRLEPFFDLLAMRSLILALRYTLSGEAPPQAILHSTLLGEAWQNLVAGPGEAEVKIARLEEALVQDYPFAAGLALAYRRQGPGGVEQQLADGILQHGLVRAGNESLKKTLRYLVDMRNVLMIGKLWHWQVSQPPPLTRGGTITTASLQHIWAAHDSGRLTRIAEQLAGKPVASPGPVAMEQCLLNGLTRQMRRSGRDPLGMGVIIEYLWRIQLAVHNQVLRQSLPVERGELIEEVLLI